MFCIQCGKKLGDRDRFCKFCGKKVPEEAQVPEASQEVHGSSRAADGGEEKLIVTLGPWGAQLCRGRAGLFAYTFYNKTRFELTTGRVRTRTTGWTVSKPPDFDIPHDAIISVEHFPDPSLLFAVMEALYIRYKEKERIVDVSVVGEKGKILKAYQILQSHLNARGTS
jgi:hypothetical protein